MDTGTDLFINNKYTKWYYELIDNSRCQSIDGYKERHHIIPRSLGGSDKRDNIVALTARQHFIAHLLLSKMCCDPAHKKSMSYALWNMVNRDSGKRTTSYQYDRLRKNHAEFLSESLKGEGNAMYGKHHSLEHRQRISATSKGHKKSDEYVESIRKRMTGEGNPMYGKPQSEEKKAQQREMLKNWNPMDSGEAKQKIREYRKSHVACYDLVDNKYVQIHKDIWNELKHIRYLGVGHSKIPKFVGE